MCGTIGTYDKTVKLPVKGRVVNVDACIHHIIAALNAGGVTTEAYCCGHGKMPGSIILSDGRILGIFKDLEAFTKTIGRKK